MMNETLRKIASTEAIQHGGEVLSWKSLKLTVSRDTDGRITALRAMHDSQELVQIGFGELGFAWENETSRIEVQIEPPGGLSRTKSGHQEIPPERQCWIVDFQTPDSALTTTISTVKTLGQPEIKFSAVQNNETEKQPFIPFSLSLEHPDLEIAKTDVLSVLQIFGHMAAAVRMLQAMPEDLRIKTHLAAKNTDNVPGTIKHLQEVGLARNELMIPLTYADCASGGPNLLDRKKALWWLTQNPELVDQLMHSKVILSDLREETAILKHLADCINIPQIFLALTFAWPQELNEVSNLHKDLAEAFNTIPDAQTKFSAIQEAGLGPDDAVVDWFNWAKKWKGGVINNHAHSSDAVLSFSLVNPQVRKPIFNNCIVMPPRTHLETDGNSESLWQEYKKRVLVILGSGDWTEREIFTKNVIGSASFLPKCHLILVGPLDGYANQQFPENATALGFVSPPVVDGLIQTADIAVIKPGHFSLEESAHIVTLIAPPDNLQRSLEISKKTGSPRSVAITVEVDEERLTAAVEKWHALGHPKDFSPLLDISNSQQIAKQIQKALSRARDFQPMLEAIPRNGTQILVDLIKSLSETNFTRDEIPQIVQKIKKQVKSHWEKK